jgi:endonuclease-3
VARKTANVVLGVAFNQAEGVVVDTHVARLGRRLGFTRETRPEKIEADLMKKIPREGWIGISHRLILHGRGPCKARNPACLDCTLRELCQAPERKAAQKKAAARTA